MYQGTIFLTIRDMMELLGTDDYDAARKRHKTIRDAISKGKNGLTIREFCKYEGYSFDEIWAFLRNGSPGKTG